MGSGDDGSVANLSFGFDRIGNLLNRSDNYGATENFCYDALNRLTNYAVAGGGHGSNCTTGLTGLVKTVSYDDVGNITNKSDLADANGGTGTYAYANPGHPLPHAVKAISGTVNGVKNPGYKYDADGNLICEYTGTNCSGGAITKETDAYWSFNMTHTISDGATSLTLTYDSEHARIVQALTTASTTTTTNYLNDAVSGTMSEKVTSGTITTWNDYLMVDGRLVGERINTASGMSWQYFILDHLGSVAVVTDGTPGSSTFGKVTARESFDAWGKQRNPDGTDNATCSAGLTSPTTRGFTSQEDIAALCLVNLNARLYDPSLGRFLSADSMIPDATDAQSYNRYTYTSNRPLSLTDPTGHDDIGGTPGSLCFGVCMDSNTLVDRRDDPAWNPQVRCYGDCRLGTGIGAPTLLDRIINGGGTGVTISQSSNGDQTINFGCQADSACENIGNEAVYKNGGTITDDGARAEYANFLRQMGQGVTYIGLGENVYLAVSSPLQTNSTEAFANTDATNSGVVTGGRNVGTPVTGHSGHFTWVYLKYISQMGAPGENLTMQYWGNTDGFQAIQYYKAWGDTHDDGNWHLDMDPSSVSPYYDSRNKLGLAPGEFQDAPTAPQGQRSFRAETLFVRTGVTGGYTPLGFFKWGFDYANGAITFLPVQPLPIPKSLP